MRVAIKTMVSLGLVALSFSSSAEVFRCTGPTGGTVYADRPCSTGPSRTVDTQPASGGFDAYRSVQPAPAAEPIPVTGAPPATTPAVAQTMPVVGSPAECRTARRELSIAASRTTRTERERELDVRVAQAEVNRICNGVVQNVAPTPEPTVIVRPRIYTDRFGNQYRSTGTNTYRSSDGRICHPSGTTMVCR